MIITNLRETVRGLFGDTEPRIVLESRDELDAPPETDDWKQHVVNAVAALVKCDDPEAHAKAKKILALLKPEAAQTTEDDDAEPKAMRRDEKKDAAIKESLEARVHALETSDVFAKRLLFYPVSIAPRLRNIRPNVCPRSAYALESREQAKDSSEFAKLLLA